MAIFEGAGSLARLAPRLEALCAAVGIPVTSRPAWFLASTMGRAERPWTVVATSGDQLDAAAMLTLRTTEAGLLVTTARCDFDDVFGFPARSEVAASAVADAIVARLASTAGSWRLTLPQIRIGDRVASLLAERLPGARLAPGRALPCVAFGPDRRLDTYLSKSMRTSLRRGRARLMAAGLQVRVELVRAAAAIASLVPRIEAIHLARDHAKGRASDIDDPAGRRFWRSVIADNARAGTLEVFLLRIQDEIAAYVVVLVDGDAYRVFDGRLDSRWDRYAPGRLLEAAVLEHALSAAGVRELDWMSSVAQHALLARTDARQTIQIGCERLAS